MNYIDFLKLLVLVDMVSCWQDQLSMKIYGLSNEITVICYRVTSFSDTHTIRLKSKSLGLMNLWAVLSSQQGAVCSAGKMQSTYKESTALSCTNTQSRESLRSYGFCSALTGAASMWQQLLGGQGGCQSHRRNDRHNRLPRSYWTSEHHHMRAHPHTQTYKGWLNASILSTHTHTHTHYNMYR